MTRTQAWPGGTPVMAGEVADAYRVLLRHAEPETTDRDGLADTPDRAARAWRELTSGYDQDPADLFRTFDCDGYDEMVVQRGIPFYSLCEHHVLPITGTVGIAYLPGAQGRIIGLSKLNRLVDLFTRRLQNQERITVQIADALEAGLDPKGVAVVVEAEHLCVRMRGVRHHGAEMATSVTRGAIRDKPEARAEALGLLRRQ